MKPASVNRRLNALRAYFNWLHNTGLISGSPLDGIKNLRQMPRAPRWLSRAEQGTLLQTAAKTIQSAQITGLPASINRAKRNSAILTLLLNTGLRVSELCALRLTDININDLSSWVIVRSGKGGKYREIPLNRDACKAIREWLMVRPGEANEVLFTNRSGTVLHPRSIQRIIKRLAEAAQLDATAVTPHSLRHSFGKNLVDAGISLDRVALLLGHKNLETTAIYTMPSRADLATAVELIVW